uniref:Probable RNA polymerase II nuclear localization protein SLC7A6OS n=1 Tax=Phallusia mammillata TaxID=59560 RepID=A0A6F9DTY4_9ASCI|nr:probable RNA polymerase II nuclear localization protein SLC7A6OS [Phallusia mammillata]
MATVIRVKRKRHAEPVEALLLASKRIKQDEHFRGNSGMADIIQIEENVFRFATTVGLNAKMDEAVKNKVKDAIVLHSKLNSIYKTQPLTSHKRSVVGVPADHSHQDECARYKLLRVSSRNPEFVSAHPKIKTSENKTTESPSQPCEAIHTDTRKLSTYFTPILDVEEQETKKCNSSIKPEDILCNSVQMLREKLCLSEPKREDDEFVYDLYYCQGTQPTWSVKDILYVQPCRDLNLCYESHITKQTYYDEDEDSNDEDHWKNDYPDDEDSIGEDEKRLFFDEEEDRYESDDCDVAPRDGDEDNFASFFNTDTMDQYCNDDLDDLDYGDDLAFDNLGDFDAYDQDDFGGDANGGGDDDYF